MSKKGVLDQYGSERFGSVDSFVPQSEKSVGMKVLKAQKLMLLRNVVKVTLLCVNSNARDIQHWSSLVTNCCNINRSTRVVTADATVTDTQTDRYTYTQADKRHVQYVYCRRP